MGVDKLTKTKICFLALNSFPTLAKTNIKLIGGAEVQQILIAKELIKRGLDISFIVHDHGQKPIEIIDDITLYKIFPVDYKIRGTKIFVAVYLMWKALKRADADIYYQRAANAAAGIVALFCILKNKKFIHSIASERNVDDSYIKNENIIRTVLYRFGIKHANLVVAQTIHQQKLLKKNFNIEGALIKSMHILPDNKPEKSQPPTVLWVSSLRELKQPELFLKIAQAIPSANFQMIGGATQENLLLYEKMKESARKIPNLDFVGFVPYHKVNQYFDSASIFINTSKVEGFPNTFIQAWARYVPTVSLNVDPDGIICKNEMGFHSKTFEQMVLDVKKIINDEQLRDEMGMNARRYVEREHDRKNIMRKHIRLIEELNER